LHFVSALGTAVTQGDPAVAGSGVGRGALDVVAPSLPGLGVVSDAVESLLERLQGWLTPEHESHELRAGMRLEKGVGCCDGHFRRFVQRVGVGAGAECGEGHAVAIVIQSELQCTLVGAGEQRGFLALATVPHGPDRVDYVASGKEAGTTDDGRTGWATIWIPLPCFLHDGGAAPAVDRTINAAASRQAAVGRIDYGVDVLIRDIAGNQFDARVVYLEFHFPSQLLLGTHERTTSAIRCWFVFCLFFLFLHFLSCFCLT